MNTNLYLRYFDDEVVVTSVDAALDFVRRIENYELTPEIEKELRDYAESDIPYPRRFKVRSRVYFIIIKTQASTMAEFKANGKNKSAADATVEDASAALSSDSIEEAAPKPLRMKDMIMKQLNTEMPGWYEGSVCFKRVVFRPETGKHDYIDNTFSARLKATSPQDCYNRLIDYLQSRPDIDERSQFPSVKGKNFRYRFLGIKPYEEIAV